MRAGTGAESSDIYRSLEQQIDNVMILGGVLKTEPNSKQKTGTGNRPSVVSDRYVSSLLSSLARRFRPWHLADQSANGIVFAFTTPIQFLQGTTFGDPPISMRTPKASLNKGLHGFTLARPERRRPDVAKLAECHQFCRHV